MRLATIFPVILALTATPSSAGMYKWTDADGNTQYGQHPPAGVQAEQIKPGPPPGSQPQPRLSPQERLKALEAEQQKQQQKEVEAATEQQKLETNRKRCEIARTNLANLKMGGHRLTRLPDGTYTRFSEEERLRRVREAEQQIKDYCQ